MDKKNYRHGDVVIIPGNIPENAKSDSNTKVVLAYGEVTGHSHRIDNGALLFKFNNKTYLRVTEPFAVLKHEEHKALKIPQGEYEIKIQQDYEPDGWKKVVD